MPLKVYEFVQLGILSLRIYLYVSQYSVNQMFLKILLFIFIKIVSLKAFIRPFILNALVFLRPLFDLLHKPFTLHLVSALNVVNRVFSINFSG